MSSASLAINTDQHGFSSQLEQDVDPSILTSIYEAPVNISVWQRQLSPKLIGMIASFIGVNPNFKVSMTVSPDSSLSSVLDALGEPEANLPLAKDISQLVEMFCCLFEQERVGLRLTVLNHAMCPRFHVDRVPCRLVTTYQGPATQWLPNAEADRSKLGHGNGGLPNKESGLYTHSNVAQQINAGDVALLKGELWEGNEGAGLIHRSPSTEQARLLLTLDFNG